MKGERARAAAHLIALSTIFKRRDPRMGELVSPPTEIRFVRE
jgi:hypothetical protein